MSGSSSAASLIPEVVGGVGGTIIGGPVGGIAGASLGGAIGGAMGGAGGPSPASYSYGGNPSAYIPTGQPQADTAYQSLIGNQFLPAASQTPGVNPANTAYQTAAGLYPQAANAYATGPGNQYSGQAIGGAQTGAAIYNSDIFPYLNSAPGDLAQSSYGLLNMLPGLSSGISGAAGPLQGVGQQLLNTGFDPQSALYNQLAGQSRDAANVANAGAGIGGTPYGASVGANAQNNFNLNWQAQQLARQTQASQAAGQNQQNIANILGQAGNVYGAGLGAAGAGLTNAGNVGMGLAQGAATANQLPYQAALGVGNNQLSGLGNLQSLLQGQANLGGQAFALPQQTLGDLASYLGLGQAAQAAGLQGGQAGFNQLSSGIGGAISGANSLFNPNYGLFGGAGIGSGIAGQIGPGDVSLAGPDVGAMSANSLGATTGSGLLNWLSSLYGSGAGAAAA